jgi:uncharacterized membrane protein YoaK (UPF0700 family)
MTTPGTRCIVLLFTFAAGCVDAINYLAAHVFTANMTGNAVLLGIYVGQGKGASATNSLVALVLFIAGVAVGALLAGEGGEKARTVAAVRGEVAVETAILAAFALAFLLPGRRESRTVTLLLIISSALAMGLQSAAVKRLYLPGIATTYITGTITNLFFGLTQHWGSQSRRSGNEGSPVFKRFGVLQAEVFLCYALAALLCGALYTRWPSLVAWLPVLAIGSVAVMMFSDRA